MHELLEGFWVARLEIEVGFCPFDGEGAPWNPPDGGGVVVKGDVAGCSGGNDEILGFAAEAATDAGIICVGVRAGGADEPGAAGDLVPEDVAVGVGGAVEFDVLEIPDVSLAALALPGEFAFLAEVFGVVEVVAFFAALGDEDAAGIPTVVRAAAELAKHAFFPSPNFIADIPAD